MARQAQPRTSNPLPPTPEGHFTFSAIQAGKYVLSAVAPGYFSASYMQHDNFYSDVVTGAGLQTVDLQLQLTRLASITGLVLDEAGEPGQNTQVALYRADPAGDTLPYLRAGNTGTDAEGHYSFRRLLPGRYFLTVTATPWYAVHTRKDPPSQFVQYRSSVDPAVDVVYPTLFYPHSARSEDARPIDLQAGDEFTANLTLTPEPSLTLTVQLPPTQAGMPNQMPQLQLLRTVFGHDEYVQVTQMNYADGFEYIEGIPPGVYKVVQSGNTKQLPVHTGTADLTAGAAIISVAATPPLATVTVHVHSAADTPLPPSAQFILKGDLENRNASSLIDAKGQATLTGIPPGDYSVAILANRPQLDVRGLLVDGKPVSGKLLHVAGAGEIHAEVTVTAAASGTTTIEGISRRDGKPAAATFVLLVPALAHYDNQDLRRDQTNLDGSYSFSNVAPGNYIVIAVDEGWKLHWQDPPALRKYLEHGIPVTISESSGKSRYQVPDAVNAQPR